MKTNLNRRDFLKLASILPAAYYLPKLQGQDKAEPNFIILVCDAWSASNTSLYGYPRQTTPMLEQLADKAIVYHNHYAAGHYTYPGTVGLLTGVLTWKNRGYSQGRPYVDFYRENNLFGLFYDYNRLAYTHNPIADAVLQRMMSTLTSYKPRQELFINDDFWLAKVFGKDYDTASTAWERVVKKYDDGYANSLFLSRLYDLFQGKVQQKIINAYPLGLPYAEKDNHYLLDTAIDWIAEQTAVQAQPFLGYYHLLPPHAPYTTRREFTGAFKQDGFTPLNKPEHVMTLNMTYNQLANWRKQYDEYILFVDSEINRLYNMLTESDALKNTWLIITSDHGEMFERGISGHRTPTFHDPLVHIPLIILPPGNQERVDVHGPTNAIDLIPTLLYLSGKSIPNWLEGELLPPYNSQPDPERLIFSMEGVFKNPQDPFTSGGVMLRQGDYKFTFLYGDEIKFKPLQGKEIYELFDITTDPEEMNNLYLKQPDLAQEMLDNILTTMKYNKAL